MSESGRIKIKMEIALFFQANPGTWETARGIALRLGRQAEPIGEELERLVELGLLERVGKGEQAVFHYVRPYMSSDLGA
ncbi:hypothetical protein SY88_13530 [Clostridiales bacterium PH28_bin88]|nr:hypothetical protein SY88_13530 [Clostridiales bacterium PH28_bin88]